ncbi:MAG: efflux RND transporter periplasmic adaptor subunit [Burkholderiaceae bacterium]
MASVEARSHALGLWLLVAALAGPGAVFSAPATDAAHLQTALVQSDNASDRTAYDGVVQAVRSTVIASQVPGAVVALDVKAGDRVRAGQVLLRLDARVAEQTASAGSAQVQAARANQQVASREFERQKQLFQQGYISQAALDRAEATFKATQAEALAQLSTAGAAQTQSGLYVVKAPYAGVVSDVAVVLGDMALPGRPLLAIYDPAALRVSVALPQTVAARLQLGQPLQVELPGAGSGRIAAAQAQLLPSADAATHTQELRLNLPAGLLEVAPGMFARAWLPATDRAGARLYVPAQTIVRRAELTGVYVVDDAGRPLLRQVRLGRRDTARVEVLSGVSAGERVALDPQAAARVR